MRENPRHDDQEEFDDPSPITQRGGKGPARRRKPGSETDKIGRKRPRRGPSGGIGQPRRASDSEEAPPLPIPDGETHILRPGSIKMPKKPEDPPRVKTEKLPRPKKADHAVTDEQGGVRRKATEAMKRIAKGQAPTPPRGTRKPVRPGTGRRKPPTSRTGIQRPATERIPPGTGRQRRPSDRQRRPSERVSRPSGRIQRPDNGPKALSASEFRDRTKSIPLEGPSKQLVDGAIHLMTVGEKVLKTAITNNDQKQARQHAARLAKTSLEIDKIFRTRLSTEGRAGYSGMQCQLDLLEITKIYFAQPPVSLIEDAMSVLGEKESEEWSLQPSEQKWIENCYTHVLGFTFEASRKMKEKCEEPFSTIHQEALQATGNLLAFMLSVPSREKDDRYHQKIDDRAGREVIRKYNIDMMVAFLQYASQHAPPVTTSNEFTAAIAGISELEGWIDDNATKFIALLGSEGGLEKSEISTFLTALAALLNNADLREITFNALGKRAFTTLAKALRDHKKTPQETTQEPDVDEAHIRHLLAKAEQELAETGDLPAEHERMFSLVPGREIYPELADLERQISETQAAREGVLEHTRAIAVAPQGRQFNHVLEYRNRAIAVLKQALLDETQEPLKSTKTTLEEAESIQKEFEALAQQASKNAYDPESISDARNSRPKPSPRLLGKLSEVLTRLREQAETCQHFIDHELLPEGKDDITGLQSLGTAFPEDRPLSATLREGLSTILETPPGAPIQQEGTTLTFRSENFTVPCLHGRGPLGTTAGHRAYGIIYTAEKKSTTADGAIEKTPVILVRTYIHEKYLPALQEEINGVSAKVPGAPTALYVVENPHESFGFAAKSVFVEYPANIPLPPPDAKGNFLTAAHLRIESFLARGGFGIVYKGRNTRGESIVVKAGLEPKDDVILESEHEIGATLKHRSIASSSRLHTSTDPLAMYGIPRGRKLLEIPFAEGKDPFEYLDEKAKAQGVNVEHKGEYMLWATEEVTTLGIQLVEAVMHAHQKGICHLDITPGNIRVAQQEQTPIAKLFDWGAAAKTGEQGIENTQPFSAPETVVIHIPDNPSEQEQLKPYTAHPRIDIHNIGATLGALLLNTPDLWGVKKIIKKNSGPGVHNAGVLLMNGSLSEINKTKQTINPFDHKRLREDRGVKEKTIMFAEGHPTERLLKLLRKATHPDPEQRIQDISEIHKELLNIRRIISEKKDKMAEIEAKLAKARAEEAARRAEEEAERAREEAEAAEAKAKAEAERTAANEERLAAIRAQLPGKAARDSGTSKFSRADLGLEDPETPEPDRPSGRLVKRKAPEANGEEKETQSDEPTADPPKPRVTTGFEEWHKSGSAAMKVDLDALRRRSTLGKEKPDKKRKKSE